MVKHISLAVSLFLAMNSSTLSQTGKTSSTSNGATLKAFAYFEQIRGQQLDDFLHSIRPRALTHELRERVLKMLPDADLVKPSAEYEAKIKSLDPVLKYHQRDAIIEIKVLRANTATAVFLAGAAILITEPALKILNFEELAAVVAHELGHEYYWNRFELARQKRDNAQMQELELRCDGIAVVTLHSVGIDPKNLISAITKLDRYNERAGSPSSANYVGFNERLAFIRQMIELAVSVTQEQVSRLASSYLQRGNEFFARGDFDRAIDDYGVAITLNPGWPLAYYSRGTARYAKGDADGAIADFDEAIKIDPQYAAAYHSRSDVFYSRGDFEKAIEGYTRAIAINPRLAEAYCNRGAARKAKGDLDGAIADYDQSLKANPHLAAAFNNRGNALSAKGNLQEAIADFDRAIKINSRYAEAYVNRGFVLLLQGKIAEAEKNFEHGIKLDPKLKRHVEWLKGAPQTQ